MERPLPSAQPGICCFLLLMLLHLPPALEASSDAPSRRNPLLPLSRNPLTRNHSGGGLLKGPKMDMLAYMSGKTWPVGEQLDASLATKENQPKQIPKHQQPHTRLLDHPLWTVPKHRKRRAAARLHHAHLMRVGCVLGTCQVQNLSHRLWQLKGPPGRRDASPVSPNSPHSYG